MKKDERKRPSLLANLSDLNRPLRVRPVRAMGREWWAIDAEDTWPGMVTDLRRLGFESIAWEDEVLVREGAPIYEPQMEGPAAPGGLKPFPTIQPTIQIRKESQSLSLERIETRSASFAEGSYDDPSYVDDYDDEDLEEEDEFEPDDLDGE